MFKITKRMEISAAHSLNLPYESKCKNLHGHNWIVGVEVSSSVLNKEGMIIDFAFISNIVKELDHNLLNQFCCPKCKMIIADGVLPLFTNPTAENIAKWIADQITKEMNNAEDGTDATHLSAFVSKVTVQESEGNTACYIP